MRAERDRISRTVSKGLRILQETKSSEINIAAETGLPERAFGRQSVERCRQHGATGSASRYLARVIYRPETELASHYFEARLPEQFDAYVWFEETRAVTPLPATPEPGMPETYPFGL
jgi:erythromycin esterase-like protein